jgi:hypothetical protein
MTEQDLAAQQSHEEAEYAQVSEAILHNDAAINVFQDANAIGHKLLAEFAQAELLRRDTEERWLKDLRQYRGLYEPDVLEAIGSHRSKAFVRATRVKVKTVDARVADLLFPANKNERNWSADPTPIPSLDKTTKAQIMQALGEALQRKPSKLEFDDACRKVAQKAADKMTQIMDDQLSESKYKAAAKKVLHSGHLYGTGILKAPLVERKTRTKFVLNERGRWVARAESYVVPFVDFVPIWRWYPDMSATELEDCRYVFERHLFTRAGIIGLMAKRSFNKAALKNWLEANPNGFRNSLYFDQEIKDIGDRVATQAKDDGQYEVLERWGWLDGMTLRDAGVKVSDDRLHETFFSNVWLLPNGEIIKIVLQPINGVTWPYHLYYTDKDETSIFADGFASVMRDDQEMINAGTRMVLDHAAITAGAQIEANMDLLSPNENADVMHPFKIWKRNGKDANSRAINVVNIPSGLEELMPIVNMFKENSDDVTAIPRYMQGENATTGAAGTASGMSMLMANASIVMKDLVENYDEVTRSFIDALYKWNMQFNPDNSCKGDFDIIARGTASLMAKEIRAQQLDQFAAATNNPIDEPYIKHEQLLRQRATAHDLADVVKTEEEVLAEKNNPQVKAQEQQQQQFAQQMQMLQLQEAQLKVQVQQAELQKAAAEIERIKSITVKTKVDTAYAGMQAGGVATERPEIAPAGDAILKAAGYEDATEQEAALAAQQQAMAAQEQQAQPQEAPPSPEQANQAVIEHLEAQKEQDPNEQLLSQHMDGQDDNPLTPPSANVGANVGMHQGIRTPQIDG